VSAVRPRRRNRRPRRRCAGPRLQQTTATPEQTPEGVFTKLRVVVPVNTDDQLEPLKVLQVIEPVPKALAQDFETVRSGRTIIRRFPFPARA
jgi:hypothetical protein